MAYEVDISENENQEDEIIDVVTADVRQPWTNYVNNGNKYLIIGAVVSSEYSNI